MPKILGIIFIIFISLIEFSFAEKKIAFIDIDKIINESEFGKKSYKKIENDFKKENEKLLKVEKKLISLYKNDKKFDNMKGLDLIGVLKRNILKIFYMGKAYICYHSHIRFNNFRQKIYFSFFIHSNF